MTVKSLTRSSVLTRTDYRSMLAGNEAYSAGAMELISTQILTGTATSVTFSSIPTTYQHLQLRVTVLGTGGNTSSIQFNSDTATNYSYHFVEGNSSTVASGALANANYINMYHGITANIPASSIIDIVDYANTSKNKTLKMWSGRPDGNAYRISLRSGAWHTTSAINSILISIIGAYTYSIGSRFSLYGIKG